MDIENQIRAIVHDYLIEGSSGNEDACPHTTGLVRIVPPNRSSPSSPTGSSTSCKRGGRNALSVSGTAVQLLVEAFGAPPSTLNGFMKSPRRSSRSMSRISIRSSQSQQAPPPTPPKPSISASAAAAAVPLTVHAFDAIEVVVFDMLKDCHLEEFMLSPDWMRYHQFSALLAQMQQQNGSGGSGGAGGGNRGNTSRASTGGAGGGGGLREDQDFFILRVVGRGGFGQVNACKKATTGKLYAMKQMSKRRIKLKRCEELIVSERDFLTQVRSPYVVNLVYAFSSPADVYLVLDLMIGGDLSYHLKVKKRFSLREAKYYTARTILVSGGVYCLCCIVLIAVVV